MLKRLDKILTMFEDVFNRKASFHWFVIILLGLVVREDTLGLTAIIREGHASIGCIAFGILQLMALNYPKEIWCKYAGWLRTKTSDIPSEKIVCSVLRRDFLLNLFDYGSTRIFKILLAKRREQRYLYHDKVA